MRFCAAARIPEPLRHRVRRARCHRRLRRVACGAVLVLGEILRRHTRGRPQKTAYGVGDARVPYAQFNTGANRLAHALHALGVGCGDRVAIVANNCASYPLAYFTCIKDTFMRGSD